ncbi:major facilitator superfamily domain-containing protein [Mycena rosella]|uniref:Major facilitator superfamily domain-containing protein n=1 Tax=Mycena rosella TaxID=1033263 RepID=A0AAD7GFU9_MYCRO|nr:major facilitator superfamily domain-containing protein [Mycena rosella]
MTGGFGPLPLAESQAGASKTGASRILGPRWTHLPTLTFGLLGVQILWSVEMSYASPYLLSLGLTKSNMAIVFLAGPLSGFLIQPLIGVLADNSTSRWGRRRPYMLGGCALCGGSMLLLGYTREFAAIFTGPSNHTNDVVTVWLAILSIYLLDFSINAVQAVDRALLVDTIPPGLQASGNAWAALMLGMGSVVGFFVGNLDLPSFLPFLGSSELQVLSVIVSVLLLAGHLTTAFLVQEQVLVRTAEEQHSSFQAEIRQIVSNIFTLPRVIRQICMVQFFAWLGWFPILFYTTMYISDLYARSAGVSGSAEEISAEGTRLGSRALFFSAILALLTNLVLPLFTCTSDCISANGEAALSSRIEGHTRNGSNDSLAGSQLRSLIPRSFKISLGTLWACSHLLFGACMLGTFFVSTVEEAIFLISLTGIPWAITQWAPFSLLAEAILTSSPKTGTRPRGEEGPLLDSHPRGSISSQSSMGEESRMELKSDFNLDSPPSNHLSEQLDRLEMHSPLLSHATLNINDATDLSAQAGVILGIHNIFIVIPQFLVTILCAVVFAMFDPIPIGIHDVARDDEREKPNSIVYIFRLGALWSLIAFSICRRLGRELRR